MQGHSGTGVGDPLHSMVILPHQFTSVSTSFMVNRWAKKSSGGYAKFSTPFWCYAGKTELTESGTLMNTPLDSLGLVARV